MNTSSSSFTFEDKTLTVSIPSFAVNADSAVLVEMNGTILLVTVAVSKEDLNLSYFPLTVDFEERFYAVGKILGSQYMRREGRPSLDSVLAGRIVDRTIRPLFPEGFKRNVHIVLTPLAVGEVEPVSLGVLGASIALQMSSIPWNGPVSSVSYAYTNNTWNAFPSITDKENAIGEGIVCMYDEKVIMVEMEGKEIPKEIVKDMFSHKLFSELHAFQTSFVADKQKETITFTVPHFSSEQKDYLNTLLKDLDLTETSLSSLKSQWLEHVEDAPGARMFFEKKVKEIVQRNIVLHDKRIDGRGLSEVRPLFAQAGGVSDVLHGTGIFHRGETRVLGVLTLGSPDDALLENSMLNNQKKHHFYLHYNFPPFATGEPGRLMGPNRRMLGHGALAQKALEGVLPSAEAFPYTIRLVTECFSSNGSTSMGSVCAGTLALMDGGVPIANPVVGIAVGIACFDGVYKNIVDIQGLEDAFGGMDFKVAGTEKGITAIQMDTKLMGVPVEYIYDAIEKGCETHKELLSVVKGVIDAPRKNISSNAPLLAQMTIPVDMIGLVIGGGGKTIQAIQNETGADVSIEDDGVVTFSGDREAIEQAQERVATITKVYEPGDVFKGTVVGIKDFGLFIDIGGGTQGLLHISETQPDKKGEKIDVEQMKKLFALGDVVEGVIKNKDQNGKLSLTLN